MDTESKLCETLQAFCDRERLPYVSADELPHEAALSPTQSTWVAAYIRLWDAEMALQQERRADCTPLAREFSARVRDELANELPEILARNRALRAEGGRSSCATHDFCDANMLMADAFLAVTGREPDCESDADAALWSDAWDLAARYEFNGKRI